MSHDLDIIEWLSNRREASTVSELASELHLSARLVDQSLSRLEQRGYVKRDHDGVSFIPTGRRVEIQAAAPSTRRLVAHARPVMQTLCNAISQSCTISVPSDADMKVVAQQDSPGPFGINVPVGYRHELPNSAPGLVFIAFAQSTNTAQWPETSTILGDLAQWSSLKASVLRAIEAGHVRMENPLLPDVQDLSCPVFEKGRFVAALTVPYINTRGSVSQAWCLAALQQAAEALSMSLRNDTLVA